MNNVENRLGIVPVVCSVLLFIAEPSFASETGMPWESALQTIVNTLTGPTALAIAVIGTFVAGATLIFGGDMNEWTRRLVMLVLVVGLLVSGTGIINGLFSATGAVI